MNLGGAQWRELLGQFEVLRTYYDRLTDRERYIVLGSIAAGLLVLMIIIYSAVAATASRIESKIEKSRKNLKQLNELRISYRESENKIREFERVIRRTSPTFRLGTHLETLANRFSVNIDSIKDRPGPPNDTYRETQVSVTVRQVTLKTLISFLFEIENSRELLRVSSLQVKPNFQDPTQLNVTFVVSTFQPAS